MHLNKIALFWWSRSSHVMRSALSLNISFGVRSIKSQMSVPSPDRPISNEAVAGMTDFALRVDTFNP